MSTVRRADRPLTVRPSALVIQTAFLGDVVLTTPLLSVLAARHGPVDVVTTPAAAGLLEGHPAVRSVLRYDKRGSDRGWGGLRRMGRELRAAVVFPGVPSAPVCCGRRRSPCGPARRSGSGLPMRRARSATLRASPRPATGHEVERLLALARAVPEEQAAVSLPLTDEDLARADAWLPIRAWEPGLRRWLRDRSGEPSAGHIFRSSPPDSTG